MKRSEAEQLNEDCRRAFSFTFAVKIEQPCTLLFQKDFDGVRVVAVTGQDSPAVPASVLHVKPRNVAFGDVAFVADQP